MDCIVKLKGMTLHTLAAKRINFATVLDLVQNSVSNETRVDPIYVDQQVFRRSVDGIRTEYLKKKYQVVYKKRRIINGFETRPWGWIGDKIN
jgi:hypothetical protein